MAIVGNIALIGACVSALFQIFWVSTKLKKNSEKTFCLARFFVNLQFIFLAFSFLVLIYFYASSDFSVLNVYMNSHSQLSWFYKIVGSWSNYEGSMLLWVFILSFYGFLMAHLRTTVDQRFLAVSLTVQGICVLGFALFVLILANPFESLPNPMPEGRGLNPLLHDPSLGFHPPLLYLGYLGFSVAFSSAIAALMTNHLNKEWASWLRPWALASWGLLTLGITLGSWWAYYELGWGGWWFWDPVENASLIPWLLGVALIHALISFEKGEYLKIWSAFLAILAFSFALVGSFIVRSGVISSVHSFAYDPQRGAFILVFVVLALGGGLYFLIKKSRDLASRSSFGFLSKPFFFLIQNILMVIIAAIVFIGSVYPMVYEAIYGAKIIENAQFYNRLIVPLFSLGLLMMILGPYLNWHKTHFKDIIKLFVRILPLSGLLYLCVMLFFGVPFSLTSLSLMLSFAVVISGFFFLKNRLAMKGQPPRSLYRMLIAHGGIAVMTFGIFIDSFCQREIIDALEEGESIPFLNYTIKLDQVSYKQKDLYLRERAKLIITKDGHYVGTVSPERRIYLSDKSLTNETALLHTYFSDLYVVLGQRVSEDKYAFKITYHPQVLWIWIGGLFMAFAGFLGLLPLHVLFNFTIFSFRGSSPIIGLRFRGSTKRNSLNRYL